ncbi:MAG: UbiA family prenyltransferase [Anaerolineales bacterium]|jgi:geranylgeranylglycerol-phosphate geranylgeranyltransferase
MKPGTKLQGLLRLFRFELPFAAGVCVLLGELLALGQLPGLKELVFGFLSVFLISAAALILNDYFDFESDQINAPDRPLPAGLVTRREVAILGVSVTLLGFAASAMISLAALLVAILVWLVGFLYNWRFKQTGLIGNLMVSFSVGMTFIFGGIVVGNPFEVLVWYFAILAALIDFGEEIAADAMDMEGDRQAGSRSVALVFGREKALKISGAIFITVVMLSWVPFIFGWINWIYGIAILLMDAMILYSTIKILDSRSTRQRMYIRWIYLGSSAALIIFIIMRLFI